VGDAAGRLWVAVGVKGTDGAGVEGEPTQALIPTSRLATSGVASCLIFILNVVCVKTHYGKSDTVVTQSYTEWSRRASESFSLCVSASALCISV
jgi:hypothetical protein